MKMTIQQASILNVPNGVDTGITQKGEVGIRFIVDGRVVIVEMSPEDAKNIANTMIFCALMTSGPTAPGMPAAPKLEGVTQ